MADKKTELMAQFYAKCQQKGYTDMTDDTQSLKAKVIATDLKLNYGNIVSFYEKAKSCYEQVQKEKAEAEAEAAEKEAKEEEKRLAKEEKEREKAEAKRQKELERQEEKRRKAAEKRKEKIQKELMDVGVKALKRGLLNTLLKKR